MIPSGKRLACARCKRLKVKCSLRESSSSKCDRCTSSKSECKIASLSTKQNASKHDERVSTLETTVANLQHLIYQQATLHRQPVLEISSGTIGSDIGTFDGDQPFETFGEHRASPVETHDSRSDIQKLDDLDDFITSGLMSYEKMSSLFESIRVSLSTAIVIATSETLTDMYLRKPITLQVLLTIAASNEPTLYEILYVKMKDRLIHEYFVKQTRTIDLIQGLLLSCEYTFPTDYKTSWTLHSFPTLATEVAMDLGLLRSETENPQVQVGDLERRRIVIWLYTVHAGLLIYSKRHPQRLLWTGYHAACHRSLQESEYQSDQILASAVSTLQLTMEILASGDSIQSVDVLQSFDRRIKILEESVSSPQGKNVIHLHGDLVLTIKAPKTILGFAGLRLVLHENHIRAARREIVPPTSVVQSREICKTAALDLLSVIENLTMPEGSACGHPGYYFAKPLGALISICRIYRWTNSSDDEWTIAYAQRVDSVMANYANDGLGLAQSMCGKAMAFLQWLSSSPVLNMDTTVFNAMSDLRDRDHPPGECATASSEVDLQTFMQ